MLTLTYGYLKPQDGDIGDEIFDAFESNIELMNSHDHDGINGEKINTSNLVKLTQAIVSGSWVLQANGIYRQLVNIVGANLYDDHIIEFRDTSTGKRIYLEADKVSATSFYVYTNDSTQDITVIYL